MTIGALYLAWQLGGLHGLRFEDLIAAATFLGNLYWAPCFAGSEGCGDPLLSSHFWSLGMETQFYALAPFLAVLPRRWLWIIGASALTAGALLSRPWGGFWWALRPDALLVGVLIGLETRRRAEWLKLIPKIGLGLASLLAARRRGAGARPVDRRDARRIGGGRCDLRDGRGGTMPG